MNTYIRTVGRVGSYVLALGTACALLFLTIATASAQVSPLFVEAELPFGESLEVAKDVTTPLIPADPEICFLADTTGSMGPALGNVAANATAIMNTVAAVQPSAEFCAAQYRDVGDVPLFSVDEDLTTTIADVQTAISGWSAGGGGDIPEAQLHALHELATGAASFDGPNRIVVWFGDSSGHDPSLGTTLPGAIADLQTAGITVIAIPVTTAAGDGLDSTGQATAITDQTNGVLLPGAASDEVADAILTGLAALTTDVWHEVQACDAGLTVTLEPAVHFNVPGGETVSFEETIAVDNDPALQGQVLTCSVDFYANSYPDGGELVGTEVIEITVPDTTPPVAQCIETVNPHGKKVPPAGSTTLPGPKGGQNEDGFYQLVAEDEVSGIASITVNGFGPFAPGDRIKVTEKNGGKEKMQKMGSTGVGNNGASDAIAAHLLLNDDAVMTVTDGAGNVTQVTCLVPPPPK